MKKNKKIPDNQIAIYQTPEGGVNIEVLYANENIRMPQKRMAELFGCTADNISLHLKNIFQEKELDESATAEGLERSILNKQVRTQLYFAHPYSSYERGTNENHNGIIRRFIPKGSDIGKEKKSTIRKIQDWMNNYPRKILGGKSPLEALIDELGNSFKIPALLEV